MKKPFNLTTLIVFLSLIFQITSGQSDKNSPSGKTFRIAFYNVENLFDTIDDPKTDDSDFLPGSKIPWNSERYDVKLTHLADVIKALSEKQAVAIMGLAEVENKAVLDDLVKSPKIIPYRYHYIHRDSPDERGIDNALLYDVEQFQPITVSNIPVNFPESMNDHTRDILYVKGFLKRVRNDTLHIFVNHWPSRSEGKEESEPKRIIAAETLKAVTDSLFNRNPLSLIVIIGDLNDEPSDKSVTQGLQALPPTDKPAGSKLYDIMDPLFRQGKGTLYYKDWDLFDQVILSGNFWNKEKGIYFSGIEGNIFEPEWLLFKPGKGDPRPNRTAAKEYYGGYSDHLPVYVDFLLKK